MHIRNTKPLVILSTVKLIYISWSLRWPSTPILLMDPKGSLLSAQKPACGLYLKPFESNLKAPIHLRYILILTPQHCIGIKSGKLIMEILNIRIYNSYYSANTTLYARLLNFWTLPIVRYSKEHPVILSVIHHHTFIGSYKPQYCGHIFGLLYIFPG
jgi:hypothetical protein